MFPHKIWMCFPKMLLLAPCDTNVSVTDKFTYERKAIMTWLSTGRNSSPMTNIPLSSTLMTRNLPLLYELRQFILKHDSDGQEKLVATNETLNGTLVTKTAQLMDLAWLKKERSYSYIFCVKVDQLSML